MPLISAFVFFRATLCGWVCLGVCESSLGQRVRRPFSSHRADTPGRTRGGSGWTFPAACSPKARSGGFDFAGVVGLQGVRHELLVVEHATQRVLQQLLVDGDPDVVPRRQGQPDPRNFSDS